MLRMLQPYHIPLQFSHLKGGPICPTTQAYLHLKQVPAQAVQVSPGRNKRVTLIHQHRGCLNTVHWSTYLIFYRASMTGM